LLNERWNIGCLITLKKLKKKKRNIMNLEQVELALYDPSISDAERERLELRYNELLAAQERML
jgi:hypothetical protein